MAGRRPFHYWLIALGVLGVVLAGLAGWWWLHVPAPIWRIDGDAPEALPPGLVIGTGAPEGYTHLVLKVSQRVDPSQAGLLGAEARGHVSRFCSVLAAKVERTGGAGDRHRLAGLAQGLGTEVGEQMCIVTSATAQKLGAELSLGDRHVLARLEENARLARVEACSDTFALLLTRGLMVRKGRHRPVALRHAFLVDANTGELATFLWGIDLDGDQLTVPFGTLRLLPGNLEWKIDLHVDPSEFLLGLPLANALAVPDLPAGRGQFPIPEGDRNWYAQSPPTPPMLARLEATLRRLAWP